MPNYDYLCEECDGEYIENVPYDQRDSGIPCPMCEVPMQRKFPSPMIMKESYPDGVKRKGWSDMREASKLNRMAAAERSGSERRKEIQNEIRKLKVDISKDTK